MQIFKTILLTCAVAAATCPSGLRAEDTATQAAARAALQEKMRELQGGTPAAEMPPATPAAPPAAVSASAPAPFVLPEGVSPDLIEQARQATRARLAELQSHRRTAIPVGSEAPVPPPVRQPMTEVAPATTVVTPPTTTEVVAPPSPAVVTEVKPAPPTLAELRAAKAREAAEKKADQARAARAKAQADADRKNQAEADAKARAASDKAAKAAKKISPAVKKMEAVVPLAPLEGPASSLPTTKEQSLQALLEQYKADKISAEEYHQQRAKIIAEP